MNPSQPGKISSKGHIFAAISTLTAFLIFGCSGGGGDPLGVTAENPTGVTLQDISGSGTGNTGSNRLAWGMYLLDIRPDQGTAAVLPAGRDLLGHFKVTKFVTKPLCDNCVRLENFSFDKSAGIIDLDAVLVNPTVVGGYDVRGVLLLDEWNTGRRLESADGLTDLWSGDPYHPDPFINFAKESDERLFGPGEEHSSHVTISFPAPYNLIVPFIVDACYPGHSEEPVEMMNIAVQGSVHPTGYDIAVSLDLLDWQDNVDGVYLDCSPMNFLTGLLAFSPQVGGAADGDCTTWTIHIVYDATNPNAWLPVETGEFEIPIIGIDSVSDSLLFQRFKVQVTEDTDPPQWTGSVGIDEVWWGGTCAIVSFYPATDPSGPVKYNIYSTTDIPLIEPTKDVIVGWSHYAVETVDGAVYQFIVKAEDQVGNEDDNEFTVSGSSTAMTALWEAEFTADLEGSPTVADINSDGVNDVVVGCDDGAIHSLSGADGSEQWFYQTGGPVKSTPALLDFNDDSTLEIVAGSNDSLVYVLTLFMGSPVPLKNLATGGVVESSPSCADQTSDDIPEIVAGSFDGHIHSFDGMDSDANIDFDTGAPIKSSSALEDFNSDGIPDIVVNSGGQLRIINGDTGLVIWSFDFGTGFSKGSPAVADLNDDAIGDVVVGTQGAVYAFDIAEKTLLWIYQAGGDDFDSSPALGDLTADSIPDVAISSRYMNVYLIDGSDGSLIWGSDENILLPTSPVLGDVNDDGVIDVVVGGADFMLRALNGVDGLTLYSWDTSDYGAVTTIPLIADVNDDGDIDIVFGTETDYMIAVTTHKSMPISMGLLPWPKFMRTSCNTGNLSHPLY